MTVLSGHSAGRGSVGDLTEVGRHRRRRVHRVAPRRPPARRGRESTSSTTCRPAALANLAEARSAGGALKIHHLDAGGDELADTLIGLRGPEIYHLALLPRHGRLPRRWASSFTSMLGVLEAARRRRGHQGRRRPAGDRAVRPPRRRDLPVKEGRSSPRRARRGRQGDRRPARRVPRARGSSSRRWPWRRVRAAPAARRRGRGGDGRRPPPAGTAADHRRRAPDPRLRVRRRRRRRPRAGRPAGERPRRQRRHRRPDVLRDLWALVAGGRRAGVVGPGPTRRAARFAVSPVRARIHLGWSPWTGRRRPAAIAAGARPTLTPSTLAHRPSGRSGGRGGARRRGRHHRRVTTRACRPPRRRRRARRRRGRSPARSRSVRRAGRHRPRLGSWPSSASIRSAGPLSAWPPTIGDTATTGRAERRAGRRRREARIGPIDTSGFDGAITTTRGRSPHERLGRQAQRVAGEADRRHRHVVAQAYEVVLERHLLAVPASSTIVDRAPSVIGQERDGDVPRPSRSRRSPRSAGALGQPAVRYRWVARSDRRG